MPKAYKHVSPQDFRRRKSKDESSLSQDPGSVYVREWSRLQTGLNAATLRIHNRTRQRKFRELNKLRASAQYKRLDAEGKKEANERVIANLEATRDIDLLEAEKLWGEIKTEDALEDGGRDEGSRDDPIGRPPKKRARRRTSKPRSSRTESIDPNEASTNTAASSEAPSSPEFVCESHSPLGSETSPSINPQTQLPSATTEQTPPHTSISTPIQNLWF
jgi:hypothetical protein